MSEAISNTIYAIMVKEIGVVEKILVLVLILTIFPNSYSDILSNP
jgi:hypothetical protein